MKSIYIYGQKEILYRYVSAFSCEKIKVICSTKLNLSDNCDALLLAGGGDISPDLYGQKNLFSTDIDQKRDKNELELLSRFMGSGKPIFGICRGMQVINVFFGGTLCQNVIGHSQVNGRDITHLVSNVKKGFTYLSLGKTALVNSAHHQTVDLLGADLIALSYCFDGHIEALSHKTLPIYATQFHPERMADKSVIEFFKNTILSH